jgi:hypothetical protein
MRELHIHNAIAMRSSHESAHAEELDAETRHEPGTAVSPTWTRWRLERTAIDVASPLPPDEDDEEEAERSMVGSVSLKLALALAVSGNTTGTADADAEADGEGRGATGEAVGVDDAGAAGEEDGVGDWGDEADGVGEGEINAKRPQV